MPVARGSYILCARPERQVEVEIDGQLYILRVGDPDGDRTRPGTLYPIAKPA